jgi:hypothetical protein
MDNLFPNVFVMYLPIWRKKMGSAPIWATFLQAHLVTLPTKDNLILFSSSDPSLWRWKQADAKKVFTLEPLPRRRQRISSMPDPLLEEPFIRLHFKTDSLHEIYEKGKSSILLSSHQIIILSMAYQVIYKFLYFFVIYRYITLT